ncbi:hypothetical protein D9611_011870 [Ephemerocybe angulata]|uniref:Uncharacterized protein n=1 Tax=Ephemerocybe angulata TaxID=980116 RepID=A0A8H5BY11_9AGAR|nr:hypothetical protein D9611_011870 [Tulosesus angulatus]
MLSAQPLVLVARRSQPVSTTPASVVVLSAEVGAPRLRFPLRFWARNTLRRSSPSPSDAGSVAPGSARRQIAVL